MEADSIFPTISAIACPCLADAPARLALLLYVYSACPAPTIEPGHRSASRHTTAPVPRVRLARGCRLPILPNTDSVDVTDVLARGQFCVAFGSFLPWDPCAAVWIQTCDRHTTSPPTRNGSYGGLRSSSVVRPRGSRSSPTRVGAVLQPHGLPATQLYLNERRRFGARTAAR